MVNVVAGLGCYIVYGTVSFLGGGQDRERVRLCCSA